MCLPDRLKRAWPPADERGDRKKPTPEAIAENMKSAYDEREATGKVRLFPFFQTLYLFIDLFHKIILYLRFREGTYKYQIKKYHQ